MSKIDDARDAEDERQPRGDQEQRGRAGQAVEQLNEQRGKRHRRRALTGLPQAVRLVGWPMCTHPVVAGQVGGAVGVFPVDHHALAVLDREAAHVGVATMLSSTAASST